MAWFVAKDNTYANDAVPYVTEFFSRMRLSKLGYTSSFESLDQQTAEAFLLIDALVEEYKAKELKKKR